MMQKYKILKVSIPQDKRADINEKVLSILASGDMQGITLEDVFNSYTGIGGLHGLSKSNYDSYHDYSKAKKEIEHGQFFTPHEICKQMAELVSPNSMDTMADITCGIGNFFNYFQEDNCYGCDIDRKAIDVAKSLYPHANIKCEDMRYFKVDEKVDYVLGNPPFNLRIADKKTGNNKDSQFYFFEVAAEVLKPAGLVLAVVPESFLQDTFFNGNAIRGLNELFDFVGQYKLDKATFAAIGVQAFDTKVMCWQKRAEVTDRRAYDGEFIDYDTMKTKIDECLEARKKLAVKLREELLETTDKVFEYKVRKYLYEIKTHPALKRYLPKSLAQIEKLKNQECPAGMNFDDWYKHHRLTEPMVLSYLKKTLAKQGIKQEDEIRLVKTSYGFKMKPYSEKVKRQLKLMPKTSWSINNAVTGLDTSIPRNGGYIKLLNKKVDKYTIQNQQFADMQREPEIDRYLRTFSFLNKDGVRCWFNKIQRSDLSLMLQKDYGILAWQMGGGKSAAALAWFKYKPQRNTFVISASLAINLTWVPFLTVNKIPFIMVKSMKDVREIKPGVVVLLTFDYLIKFEKWLKEYVKRNSQKVNLVFDESDEITNSTAKRTRAVLNVFRRVKRKLCTTGTTTRNNIAEIYSQLELLYNNSSNFITWSPTYYVEEQSKEFGRLIKEKENKYWKRPFPAYYGQTMFRRCFNPTKSTVFGIDKQNQDLYNEKDLREIIGKTVITRKFKEIAGDKYTVENVRIHQDTDEREVYRKIIKDLDQILPAYFNSTGNDRKDAMLRAMRQLTLLIQATSTPQLFDFYRGSGTPNKARKIFELLEELDEKVAIGCTSIGGVDWYVDEIKLKFPDREVFKIVGDVDFRKRKGLIEQFEATSNGILVCTQQSLKSSVNIPTCDVCIVESLQWNIPKIEQFFFRFIRYDSKNSTRVIFVNYEGTIEVNLLALLMAKEKLNDYVKTLEYREDSDIYQQYDIDLNILNELITKSKDEEGNLHIEWGESKVVA